MNNSELINKAIRWFKVIADDMEMITTGNLPHCAATTKGRAIRAYEFLEKHKSDYDPYEIAIKSILEMFEHYNEQTDKEDFLANIKVKCKEAVEYIQ